MSISPLLRRALLIAILSTSAGCAQAGSPTAPAQALAAAEELDAQRAYTIETVLGIGPTYGAKLRAAGITNTDKLLAATKTRYKRQTLAAKTDVPYKLVMAWAQKVAVMDIAGIGPRQSNLLAAVGVASITELAQRDPAKLSERVGVANAFKPHFVANTPSLATVSKWVQAAKKLAPSYAKDE